MILLLTMILLSHAPPHTPPKRLPPEAVCPAFWKCIGPPETRAADCKCWDRY